MQIKGGNKVTTVRPRNVVRLLNAPLELATTKIGAENSERAPLARQDSRLPAKEPRKDSPPAAREAWSGGGQTGRTDRTLDQSPKSSDGHRTNGRSGIPLPEVTPPNCQAAPRGWDPKGEGCWRGRGRKVSRARAMGRRRQGGRRTTARGLLPSVVRSCPKHQGLSRSEGRG